MNLTGVSKRCVQDCINVLIQHELIEVLHSKTRDGDDAPNRYTISVYEPVVENEKDRGSAAIAPPHAKDDIGGMQPLHGVGQPLHQGSATIAPTKETLQKKNTSKEDIAPNASLRSYDIDFSFESASFEGIIEKDLSSWKELYPAVDVGLELKKMAEWCIANTKKAKSKKKWRQFINNWLRENNEKIINKQAYQSRGKDPEKVEQQVDNETFAKNLEYEYHSKTYTINALSKCLELTPNGNGQPVVINYSENGFKDQVRNALMKAGFSKKKNN